MLLVLLLLLLLLLLVFVLLVVVTAPLLLLLLLLLCLLQQAAGVGQVVAGVVVLGFQLQRLLVGSHGLLEVLHALSPFVVGQSGLHQAVAFVVEGARALVVVDIGCREGLVVVAGGFVVFLLPVEAVGQVVLSAEVVAVAFQSAAVGRLGLVEVFLVVGAVAFAQRVAAGLRLEGGRSGGQPEQDEPEGCGPGAYVLSCHWAFSFPLVDTVVSKLSRFHLRLRRS